MLIKNYKKLAKSQERRICLLIINFILKLLQPEEIVNKHLQLVKGDRLLIKNKKYLLDNFENIYLIGIGKGSFRLSFGVIHRLKKIKEAYVIDLKRDLERNKDVDLLKKINFTKGNHPLPSKNNFNFSKRIIKRFYQKVSKKDLIFVVICGGGSAMLVYPAKISLDKYININNQLLKSGANIYEMNTVRKHLDYVKGGGLAKLLYPAKIISLIFSDVPEDDLSFIASGPTVKDKTTINDALRIIRKYNIKGIKKDDLIETTKENKYFGNVDNLLILNNSLILKEVKKFIEQKFQLKVKILTDKLKGEVSQIANYLLGEIKKANEDILLLGGETTVKVRGKGRGGRNQELVMHFLKRIQNSNIKNKVLIISINSDGWDNTPFAGAIGDYLTLEKAKKMNLDLDKFLADNNSFNFFKKVGDGIITGRLPINIADLILVFKNK